MHPAVSIHAISVLVPVVGSSIRVPVSSFPDAVFSRNSSSCK